MCLYVIGFLIVFGLIGDGVCIRDFKGSLGSVFVGPYEPRWNNQKVYSSSVLPGGVYGYGSENSTTSPFIQTRDTSQSPKIPHITPLEGEGALRRVTKPPNSPLSNPLGPRNALQSSLKTYILHKPLKAYKNLKKKAQNLFQDPLHPIVQSLIAFKLYYLHIVLLSKTTLQFPVQIIPNSMGLFQSVGLDVLLGGLALTLLPSFRKSTVPWKISKTKGMRVVTITILLTISYILSGFSNQFSEALLLFLTAMGAPISVAMHRSLQILTSHLIWVGIGSLLLEKGLHPFSDTWYKLNWRGNWVWWSVCGFYGSHFLFTLSALINQFVVPLLIKIEPSDTVVNQMIQPENNDVLALLVGSLAPCVSAPWWEEVLYRGFALPSLNLISPVWVAKPLSALFFAAHHLNLYNFLPLTVLGYAWAELYTHSQNLLVPILIHAMWNSRIFLGSLLGQ